MRLAYSLGLAGLGCTSSESKSVISTRPEAGKEWGGLSFAQMAEEISGWVQANLSSIVYTFRHPLWFQFCLALARVRMLCMLTVGRSRTELKP